MKGDAAKIAKLIYKPEDRIYSEEIRRFQGCTTVAVTKGGRIYLGWYSGGDREPHIDNYNLLVYSDDKGKTFSSELLVIPGSRDHSIQSLDIQLWVDGEGALHVYWVQNDVSPALKNPPPLHPTKPRMTIGNYMFDDCTHAWWESVCRDPDANEPIFEEPRYLGIGFLRCKPLVMDNGETVFFNYDQLCDRYGYTLVSADGKTRERLYGAEKIPVKFDETMAYQLKDGRVRMLARSLENGIVESYSADRARSWSEARPTGIKSPNTRFFVSRTPSGRVMLIHNDHDTVRTDMTVLLSDDDGATWSWGTVIDRAEGISYPDADFLGESIVLTYDRCRTAQGEIMLTVFNEDDVINGTVPTPWVISKNGKQPL